MTKEDLPSLTIGDIIEYAEGLQGEEIINYVIKITENNSISGFLCGDYVLSKYFTDYDSLHKNGSFIYEACSSFRFWSSGDYDLGV